MASSGLGRATAEYLAVQGYHVILAGRSLRCLSEAVEEIEQRHEGVSIKALELDLCSLSSMLKFRDSVQSWLKAANLPASVQLLINNAGILATRQRFTSNGYDSMISSNYLGAFMLTQLLLPLLQCSTQPSRIVNVTSFTHRCVRDIEINEAKLAKGAMQGSSIWNCYRLACNYESSKLCLMLFTYQLHRLLYLGNPSHPISIMAADPGAVETRIFREVPPWLSWLIFKALKFICLLQSPREGARAIVDAALAPMSRGDKDWSIFKRLEESYEVEWKADEDAKATTRKKLGDKRQLNLQKMRRCLANISLEEEVEHWSLLVFHMIKRLHKGCGDVLLLCFTWHNNFMQVVWKSSILVHMAQQMLQKGC